MRKIWPILFGILLFAGCGSEDVYLTADTESASPVTAEDVSTAEQGTEPESKETESEEPQTAFVYLCGEVNSPGVYEVPIGSRIYEAVEKAGGLTEDAEAAAVNQAEMVSDGMMIRVPAVGEAELTTTAESSDGRVNLNTATLEELMTLPGIGESKAQSILTFREERGGFTDITELMEIAGIKEGVFSKLKEKVKV